jgi:gas vesicle protein
MNKQVSNFLVGFLAGAAVGAIAGILFAPEKGSKTRQNLGRKIKDLSDEFGLGVGDLFEEMDIETETEPVPQSRTRKASSRKTEEPEPKKRKYTRTSAKNQ